LPMPGTLEQHGSDFSHSTPGIFTLDLLLGVLAFAVWHILVVPFAVAAAPGSLRDRLAPRLPVPWREHVSSARKVALVAVSLIVGAITHVFWDEFTHPHRWGPQHIGWLDEQQGLLPGYRWAQYASGVFGLVAIAVSVLRWWRSAEVTGSSSAQPQRVTSLNRATSTWIWGGVVLAAVAGGLVGAATSVTGHAGPGSVGYTAATYGGGAGLVVVLLSAVLFRPRD
jgi:hypothetical protein